MSNKFPKPRKWIPKNPDKYIGDVNNIITRSSWETKFLVWLDSNPSVIRWNSEEMVVPYFNPLDSKMHRYFVDFVATMKLKSGIEKTYAIEIKPLVQCLPPKPNKNRQRLLLETSTYIINQEKWKAARKYCSDKGIEFLVLTEKDLGI